MDINMAPLFMYCILLSAAFTGQFVEGSRRRIISTRRRSIPISTRRRSCSRINCQVSSWGSWNPCSVTCGTGSKSRTRSITRHASCGGYSCPTLTETTSCTITENRNCTVSEWMSWMSCSSSCGIGQQSRSRSVVQGKTCSGTCPNLMESKRCEQYIAKNCTMSRWSGWTECSTVCMAKGNHSRYRTVSKPAYCGGICLDHLNETGSCDGSMGPWSTWSICSAQCSYYGTKSRNTTYDCGAKYPRLNDNSSCYGTCCNMGCGKGLVSIGEYPHCGCTNSTRSNRGINYGLQSVTIFSAVFAILLMTAHA